MKQNNVILSVGHSIEEGVEHLAAEALRVGRGAVAGFIAGAVASWVMNQYKEIESRPVNVRLQEQASGQQPTSSPTSPQELSEDPKVKVAQKVSRQLFEHELTDSEKKVASPTVHYGYGATVGALYGGLSEVIPVVGAGLGIPYATLLWLGGDEIAVPAFGLSKPATQKPAEHHASSLATHFVYGITLDITRRILRRLI